MEPVSASIRMALSHVMEGASGHAADVSVLPVAAATGAAIENTVPAIIVVAVTILKVFLIYFLNALNIDKSPFSYKILFSIVI